MWNNLCVILSKQQNIFFTSGGIFFPNFSNPIFSHSFYYHREQTGKLHSFQVLSKKTLSILKLMQKSFIIGIEFGALVFN